MKSPLIITSDLDGLDAVAATILGHNPGVRIFTLTGMLGAGKTTLVKSFLARHGIESSEITSPTFTYCNVYKNEHGKLYYHFDLYRIQSMEAFCDMGFHEYLYDRQSIVFIEWPDVIMPLLQENVCQVFIDYTPQINQRVIRVKKH